MQAAFLEETSLYFGSFSLCIYLAEVPLCYYKDLLWILLFSTSVITFLAEEWVMEAALLFWYPRLIKEKKQMLFPFSQYEFLEKKWHMEGQLGLTVQSLFLTAPCPTVGLCGCRIQEQSAPLEEASQQAFLRLMLLRYSCMCIPPPVIDQKDSHLGPF